MKAKLFRIASLQHNTESGYLAIAITEHESLSILIKIDDLYSSIHINRGIAQKFHQSYIFQGTTSYTICEVSTYLLLQPARVKEQCIEISGPAQKEVFLNLYREIRHSHIDIKFSFLEKLSCKAIIVKIHNDINRHYHCVCIGWASSNLHSTKNTIKG